jgi:hypothetical protein
LLSNPRLDVGTTPTLTLPTRGREKQILNH